MPQHSSDTYNPSHHHSKAEDLEEQQSPLLKMQNGAGILGDSFNKKQPSHCLIQPGTPQHPPTRVKCVDSRTGPFTSIQGNFPKAHQGNKCQGKTEALWRGRSQQVCFYHSFQSEHSDRSTVSSSFTFWNCFSKLQIPRAAYHYQDNFCRMNFNFFLGVRRLRSSVSMIKFWSGLLYGLQRGTYSLCSPKCCFDVPYGFI